MTCAASISDMIGVELVARELSGSVGPGFCASAIAHVIVQMNTVALSITYNDAKGAPVSELCNMKRGYSQATTLVCSALMAIVTRHGFDACATCTS